MHNKKKVQIVIGETLIKLEERKCPVKGCHGIMKVKLQEWEGETSKGDMVVFDREAVETGITEKVCNVCGCLLSIPCSGGAEVEQYPISSPS